MQPVFFFSILSKDIAKVKVGRYIILLVTFMCILIAFGNRGLIDNYVMRERLKAVGQLNREIADHNSQLKAKIVLLRNNLQYIEMTARNELGMVKKGDIVYRTAK
jgi:cell division protein FtsB